MWPEADTVEHVLIFKFLIQYSHVLFFFFLTFPSQSILLEAKENMNQIIKDFAHPADKFGFQSFGDGKTLTKLHLHLK